ncbi:hypothetical protein NNC19_21785 [Clostridium sp. SHJSY1]|uniref:hypothetical protein n=1 Tax=Clostridium sp. SHJSY1 TaxID=2942483 RepID=UPI002876E55C|nr:hypothetical protein [Clostridium sp. SHJSY1]MDS0528322.1 hypothetical protein [Clostridium sp. SHJSY1]
MVTAKLITKNNKSRFYYVSFVFIILAYFIFFNARNVLPDSSEIMQTPANQEINVGSSSIKITLNRFEYNQNENFMEVEFKYSNKETIATDFNFLAKVKTKNDKISEINVNPIINTNNTCILHIENIPKEYKVISLKAYEKSSQIDTEGSENDSKNQNASKKESYSASMYFDYRKIEINNELKVESEKYYMMNIVKNDIENINKEIEVIDEEIKKNLEFVDISNKKIEELNGQVKYQIDKEVAQTKQQIQGYKTKINESIEKNEELKTTKNSKLEKIKKLNEKLNDISKNK